MHNASQGLIPERNAGLSSHCPGTLNNSKWPLLKSWVMMSHACRANVKQFELTIGLMNVDIPT
jgi:hypothetical protein